MLQTGTGYSVWGTRGLVFDAGSLAGRVSLTPWGVIAVDSTSITFLDDNGEEEVIASFPGEFALCCPETGLIGLARPREGGRFGESWVLRAVSPHGLVQWEATVPAVPLEVAGGISRIYVAAVDVASHGEAFLFCLDSGSGLKLWAKGLGSGLWRGLFWDGDRAVAVLEDKVLAFSSDGDNLWTFDPPGSLLSADAHAGYTLLSWAPGSSSPARKLASNGVLMLDRDGAVLWKKQVPGKTAKVQIGEAPAYAVVLSEGKVTGLSLGDGQQVFCFARKGLPVDFSGEFALYMNARQVESVRVCGK